MKFSKEQIESNKLLVNFSEFPIGYKEYNIGTMEKDSRIILGIQYMVKQIKKDNVTQYKSNPYTYFNSVFSEYIACKMGKRIGLNIQDTLLGYTVINSEYIPCVACKDFCDNVSNVLHFSQIIKIVNDINKLNLQENDWYDVLHAIKLQPFVGANELKEHFLDMFVFDSFIGNFDRNLKNLGLIKNNINNTYTIAPIYDCGSSMHPKTPRYRIIKYKQQFEKDKVSVIKKTFNTPKSFFQINNKKINYYNFLIKQEFNHDKDIAEAIKRVVPKILENMKYTNDLIDSLSGLMDRERIIVLKTELNYKAEHMLKKMLEIAKEITKEKEQSNSWIKKDIDDDWER